MWRLASNINSDLRSSFLASDVLCCGNTGVRTIFTAEEYISNSCCVKAVQYGAGECLSPTLIQEKSGYS